MKYLIVIGIMLGVGLYLYGAFVRIYSTIGVSNLANPTVHQQIVVNPKSAVFTKKIVYVALGDSLTAGVGASAEDKTYPYQLAQLLADNHQAQVTLVNLSWPGATAVDVLKNQVPLVAPLNPDVITVAIGTNDMHNRVPSRLFKETMSGIVGALTTSTARVSIINIPFNGSRALFMPPYRLYFDWQIKRYNSLINEALVGQKVKMIDLYSLTRKKAFTDDRYYSTDGFHPSDDGYKFWSNILNDNLNF